MALIKTKSVSFNVENEDQNAQLEWATSQPGRGFSDYVKELIAHDMKLRKKAPQAGQGIQINVGNQRKVIP